MSAILSADDLNDFISPGVACIKPVETITVKPSTTDKLEVSFDIEPTKSSSDQTTESAQISLTDCLACSGCVTSSEAVLVSLQSHAEVLAELDSGPALRISSDGSLENLEHGGRIYVASVSPQTRASLAVIFGVSQREAGYMIEQLLSGPVGIKNRAVYRNYFQWVIDTNVARSACLVMGADEVMASLLDDKSSQKTGVNLERQVKKPILTSSCPGWICYAEKTHPNILPHLSKLKSPQALTGTLLKTVLSRKFGISPSRIWHVAIMPCFDKKLEASREELTDTVWAGDLKQGIRDVDSVLTSKELLMLADTRHIDFAKLPRRPVSRIPFPDPKLDSFIFPNDKLRLSNRFREYGTSGGNLYYILNFIASQNKGSVVHSMRGRNMDVLEFSVVSPTGEILLRAARYYGFRNIQNLVRRLTHTKPSRMPGGKSSGNAKKFAIKRLEPEYSYVEVMACPGGCTNGGGQVKFDDPIVTDRHIENNISIPLSQKEWLSKVDEAYFSEDDFLEDSQTRNERDDIIDDVSHFYVKDMLAHWANVTRIDLAKLVFTTYRQVESEVGKNSSHSQNVIEIAGKIGGGW